MKIIFNRLFKYLPDSLVNIGIWIFAYYMLIPPDITEYGILPKLPKLSGTLTDYHTDEKMIGVVIITIGFTIAIRRLLEYKKLLKHTLHKNETMDSK